MAQASGNLEDFLRSVNPSFGKYAEKLNENGLMGAEDLGVMQDEDFKYLGIPLFHWRQIVAKAKAQATTTESQGESEPAAAPAQPAPAYGGAPQGGAYGAAPSQPIQSQASLASHGAAGWGPDEVQLWVRTRENGQYAQFAPGFRFDGAALLSIQGVKELTSTVADLGARYGIYQCIEELQRGPAPGIRDLLALDNQIKGGGATGGGGGGPVGQGASPFGGAPDWAAQQEQHNKKAEVQNLHVVKKEESAIRQRLVKFYEIYNPHKLDDQEAIDELLRRYQGRETQLFSDLEQKYVLGAPAASYKKKELANKGGNPAEPILKELSRLYHQFVRDVEAAFQFPEFHTPLLDQVDFLAVPMVMLVGQYSVGKTSFIRYLIGRDFPGIRIGPEPTTDVFMAIMHGRDERTIPGHTVPMDRTKPFRTLQQFGAGFLNRFNCAEVPAPLLESISFVDTPGILAGQKQKSRNYEFSKVVEWFAYRSDRILLLFDAHKLDISDEFKQSIEMLKGHDDKIRCVLNKADTVSNQHLLRVYGALMWSLGKVFKTPEVVRVYVGSFWDEPYQNDHNAELFDMEADDLISDLRGLPRHAATRKINEFVKRTRQLQVHCLIIEHLRKQFGFFGKDKKQKKLLDNLRNEFRSIAKEFALQLNDFPNPDKFRSLIEKFEVAKFPKFKQKWQQGIHNVLHESVPSLMRKLPSSKGSGGDDGKESNPFETAGGQDARLDPTKQWAVSQVDKSKYDTKFYSLHLQSGKASGNQIMNVMMQSSLSRDVLRTIWELSDIDQDGKMDDEEFALCMYLIDMVKSGVKLPPSLPIQLVPPGKRHLVEYS